MKGALRRDEVEGTIGKFCRLDREQLQKIVQNPKSTMLEIMVASVMAKAAKDGDASTLNFLLDRSTGKVKDIAEVHTHNYDTELDKEPKENVLALLRELRGPKLTGT